MRRSDFIPQLVLDLEERLVCLQREATALRRALRALDPPHLKVENGQPERLVELLRQHPNARPSVLALARGASVDVVLDELHLLRHQGIVVQDGPRWRLSPGRRRREERRHSVPPG